MRKSMCRPPSFPTTAFPYRFLGLWKTIPGFRVCWIQIRPFFHWGASWVFGCLYRCLSIAEVAGPLCPSDKFPNAHSGLIQRRSTLRLANRMHICLRPDAWSGIFPAPIQLALKGKHSIVDCIKLRLYFLSFYFLSQVSP